MEMIYLHRFGSDIEEEEYLDKRREALSAGLHPRSRLRLADNYLQLTQAYHQLLPSSATLQHHPAAMSRPLALPIRLVNSSTQCLRQQRPGYAPLRNTISSSSNTTTRQWTPPAKRSFANTTPARSMMRGQMKQPAQPSISRAQKEQQEAMIRSGQVPDDVGLLQGTFVLPRASGDRWSWRLRKRWLWVRMLDAYGMIAFKWMVKPRPKFELTQIAPKAAEMHREMYSAFAQGDLERLQPKVCNGLFGSLRGRVQQRAPNTFLRWSVKKQLSSPKLCSFKAAVLPGPKGESADERNAQIQAVVKLHTVQSLQHVKRVTKRVNNKIVTQEELVGAEEEKESVEYVVVQKTLRKGKMNNWQLWGFTNETSLSQLLKEDAKK
jgi:protein MBA1